MESKCNIEKESELSAEIRQFKNEFLKLFERKGKMKNHQVRMNFKPGAKRTQQKGRRIPIQLQKTVDEEIDRLLKRAILKK